MEVHANTQTASCYQPADEEDLSLRAKMSASPNVTVYLVSEPDNISNRNRDLLYHTVIVSTQAFNQGLRGGNQKNIIQKNIIPWRKKAPQIEDV